MAHGSSFDVLEEHVVGVIVCWVCGVAEALRWCMACGKCSWGGRSILYGTLLSLPPLLAKFGGGCVDAVDGQGYCGEVFDSANVRVDQQESVNAGKVVGV